jgi:LysR family glycine cleavage system transcriptional activator
VSHQIKSLEQELGQQLFERSSRSLRLSRVGVAMFEEACPLMAGLDEVAARYRQRDVRRVLRISVQPFFASELFVPRLSEFTEKHPDLNLIVDTSNESSEILPENADVGIRLFRSPPENASFLFPLRLVPVGSPEFKDGMTVEDGRITSKFPIIVHETRPTAWQQWATTSGVGLPGNGNVIRLDSMIAIARAAQRGLGAALVPAALSDDWFESGSLVRLFDVELVSEDGYYLLCRDDKSDETDVLLLRDWVLQNFNEET